MEYLKSWSNDTQFRAYLRLNTPFKLGIPKDAKELKKLSAQYEKYQQSKFRFYNYQFYSSGQVLASTKNTVVQYFYDLKATPLRFIWAPYNPAQFTNQSKWEKFIDWPSHYLTHPIAEATGSYRQLSIFGNLLLWSGIIGGLTYYKIKNHQQEITKAQDLLLNDLRFLEVKKQLEFGFISFEQATNSVLKKIEVFDYLKTIEDFNNSPYAQSLRKLDIDKYFFNTEDLNKYKNQIFLFLSGQQEHSESLDNILSILKSNNQNQINLLTNFGMLIPSQLQSDYVEINPKTKLNKSLNTRDDLLTYALTRPGLMGLYSFHDQTKHISHFTSLVGKTTQIEGFKKKFKDGIPKDKDSLAETLKENDLLLEILKNENLPLDYRNDIARKLVPYELYVYYKLQKTMPQPLRTQKELELYKDFIKSFE